MLTNAGRDLHAACVYSTGAQPAAANYIGLSANDEAPAAGDTTLTGEIATPGGGLIRGQGAYTHEAGTDTVVVSKTFTATGSDVLPVELNSAALFNAAANGTMPHRSLFDDPATLSAPGDQVNVEFEITLVDAS